VLWSGYMIYFFCMILYYTNCGIIPMGFMSNWQNFISSMFRRSKFFSIINFICCKLFPVSFFINQDSSSKFIGKLVKKKKSSLFCSLATCRQENFDFQCLSQKKKNTSLLVQINPIFKWDNFILLTKSSKVQIITSSIWKWSKTSECYYFFHYMKGI